MEDQEQADKRIPELIKYRDLSRVVFLSCEPLLGDIDLRKWILEYNGDYIGDDDLPCGMMPVGDINPKFDWVIAGGESGPNARPSHPEWFRVLRDQCKNSGVPFNFKQWGEWASVSDAEGEGQHFHFYDGTTMRRVGKKKSGRLLDGVEWNQFPEFPQ